MLLHYFLQSLIVLAQSNQSLLFSQGALATALTLTASVWIFVLSWCYFHLIHKWRDKNRSRQRSHHLDSRTSLSLFTRAKEILRLGEVDQVALILSQPLVLPGACQPAKSQCCSSLSAHYCPGWRGGPVGFGEGQGTGPARKRGHKEEGKKNPGEMHQNSAESKTLAIYQELAKKWNSHVQGQSSEDILKLEIEINSSFLSAWHCIWWVPKNMGHWETALAAAPVEGRGPTNTRLKPEMNSFTLSWASFYTDRATPSWPMETIMTVALFLWIPTFIMISFS